MRIGSVNENESYLYSTLKNKTSKVSQTTASELEELYKLGKSQNVEEANNKDQYSAAEHMVMMQGSKMMPEYALGENEEQEEAGDISSIDEDGNGTISTDEYETMISQMGIPNALDSEEFFAQYDSNEDGEISEDEMPEPGSVGVKPPNYAKENSAKGIASIDEDEDGTISTDEYEAMISQMGIPNANRLLMGLQNYEKNYESMFETLEGTQVNGLA